MRIYELIGDGKRTVHLYHPILGNVVWENHGIGGYGLYFTEGPDKGEFLYADDVVLLSDEWSERQPT